MVTTPMEIVYPVSLTLKQMQRLRQVLIAAPASSTAEAQDDHNLARRLTEYLANAQSAAGIGYVVRRA